MYTGDVAVLCAATYAKIQPIIAKALDAYHATLAVAQLGVDCVSSGLDWIVESATWLLESSGLIETLPIPNDICIPKRTSSPPFKLVSPPTSRDVDTSSSPWKPRKADYRSTARFTQVSAPAPKTGDTVPARREAARLDTIAEDSSEATIPGSDGTTSTPIATSASPITPPTTTNTAIERPAGAGAQDAAGEPSTTPHDSGAALSTQVSGRTRKTGLFGESRPQVAAAMASAGRSRPISQANIDRIENASRRPGFKSSGRRRREAVVAPLETIAEDDRVVTFSDELQVQDVPMSVWDELARREFTSEEVERRIEAAYWAWVEEEEKVLPRIKAMIRGIRAKINARRVATFGRWARVRAVFHHKTA
ncbi:hypothetical protein FRC05_010849 [Tulasnella sp. 425]|nr:hypothetical protein FRC05_010849 [Tulasnella sp. 425]